MSASPRIPRLAAILGLAVTMNLGAGRAIGQEVKHAIWTGVGYTYVRTNIIPGCNCVALNGGYGQMQYSLGSHWAALVNFTGARQTGITTDGYALTQLTYTGGLRYWPMRLDARLRPFADVALGGAYAGGSLSPANSGIGGSADAFAFQAGGGLQLRLSSRWMLQPVQAEYLMTTFSNNGSNRQNDLRLGTGLMVRFGH